MIRLGIVNLTTSVFLLPYAVLVIVASSKEEGCEVYQLGTAVGGFGGEEAR
jgi:hypothetical protein